MSKLRILLDEGKIKKSRRLPVKVYLAGRMDVDWRWYFFSKTKDLLELEFLTPLETPRKVKNDNDPAFYMPRDLHLIKQCDVVLAHLTDQKRNAGLCAEIGVAWAWQKVIILMDYCPSIRSFDFVRSLATTVVPTNRRALNILLYMHKESEQHDK